MFFSSWDFEFHEDTYGTSETLGSSGTRHSKSSNNPPRWLLLKGARGQAQLPLHPDYGRSQFTNGATQVLQYKTNQNRGNLGVGEDFVFIVLKCS